MRIAAHFRRVCCPLLAATVLLLIAGSCHAVTMRITAGFDGVFKSRQWTPIAVQLANTSDEDVEGMLVVSEPDGITTPIPVCTSQVNLPAHSTKLYHAYIRLPGYGGKVRVALARGYGVLAAKESTVNASADDDRLIVAIGERASRLSFLQNETVMVRSRSRASSSGLTQATIHAGSLAPALLPDRPAAYEGADVIVISGLSPESTDPNALKAICAWVASGGTLVVSTGPDYHSYTNAFYEEILPVTIQSAVDLPGMSSLSSMGGVAFPSGPAAVAKSVLKPGIGRALFSEGAVPLIAERKYGAGRVVFLAFDIKAAPFKDWGGQIKFWKSWITDAKAAPFIATEDRFAGDGFYGQYPGYGYPDENDFSNVVMQNVSVKTPSLLTVGLFLVAYLVVLVPINYAVLRVKRRLELAWITTPAIVLLFTVGAYAIGYTMKGGNLRLCEATLIEGSSNARFARVVSTASLFSPARRSYSITVADPSAISQIVPATKDEDPPTTYLGDTSVMDHVGMAMWSSKTFQSVSGEDLGGVVESRLKLNADKLTGDVTNNTGLELRDCTVRYGQLTTSPVRLSKGEVLHVKLTRSAPVSPYYNDPRVSDRMRKFVEYNSIGSGPVLIAFAAQKGAVFDVANGHARADRATCYVFHLDYEQGNTVAITPGMVTAWREGAGNPGVSSSNGMLGCYLYDNLSFVGVYRLSVSPGFKVTSLKVVGRINGSAKPGVSKGIVDVGILNRLTGKWDSITIPSGAPMPDPARYVGANGEVKLKCTSLSGGSNIKCGLSAEAKRQ